MEGENLSCEKHSAVPLEYRWHASVQSESLRLGAAPDQNLGNHAPAPQP